MNANTVSLPTRKGSAKGLALKDAPIEVAVAYLMETYDLNEDEAREKVRIAKGIKTPRSRAIDE